MHPIQFFSRVEQDQIVAAIRAAEARTTGKIRLVISRGKVKNAVKAAQRQFEHHEMHLSPGRNAILIYVAPFSQKFAVIGDRGVHTRVGEAGWQSLVSQMAEHFKREQIMPALLFGIQRAGELLAEHFPKS